MCISGPVKNGFSALYVGFDGCIDSYDKFFSGIIMKV